MHQHAASTLRRLTSTAIYRIGPVRRWWIRRKFAVELALIADQHEPFSDVPSIIHFSVNRAATQYVKSILFRCARESDLVPVQFHAYSFVSDFPYLDQLDEREAARFRYLFRPNGYLYSDLGGIVEGIPLEEFRIILAIRDPRDVLTSEFFSAGYSHVPPIESRKVEIFAGQRQKALDLGIDGYTISESARIRRTYERYVERLDGLPRVHVAHYERMIDDFPGWLDSILQFCEMTISRGLRHELLSERSQPPAREDPTRHLRQVTPGDFRRKLKQQTIQELNEALGGVLLSFGYQE